VTWFDHSDGTKLKRPVFLYCKVDEHYDGNLLRKFVELLNDMVRSLQTESQRHLRPKEVYARMINKYCGKYVYSTCQIVYSVYCSIFFGRLLDRYHPRPTTCKVWQPVRKGKHALGQPDVTTTEEDEGVLLDDDLAPQPVVPDHDEVLDPHDKELLDSLYVPQTHVEGLSNPPVAQAALAAQNSLLRESIQGVLTYEIFIKYLYTPRTL